MAKSKYGTRPKHIGPTGVRQLGRTFGASLHFVHATKVDPQLPFLVDKQAEGLVANVLELDPEVKSFWNQPFMIDLVECRLLRTKDEVHEAKKKYRDRPGHSLYTPDFEARLFSEDRDAVEVKLEGFEGDNDYVTKLRLAAEILASCGYGLKQFLVTSEQTRAPWTTVPLLYQGAQRKDLWPDEAMYARIAAADEEGATTGQEFIRALKISANLLPVYIAAGALSIDVLAGEICGATPMRAAYGDLGHLSLYRRLTA